jgi:hypothetical protein
MPGETAGPDLSFRALQSCWQNTCREFPVKDSHRPEAVACFKSSFAGVSGAKTLTANNTPFLKPEVASTTATLGRRPSEYEHDIRAWLEQLA